MTVTFEFDLDNVKMNQHAKYLRHRSFSPHRNTHSTDCTTWTTKAVSKTSRTAVGRFWNIFFAENGSSCRRFIDRRRDGRAVCRLVSSPKLIRAACPLSKSERYRISESCSAVGRTDRRAVSRPSPTRRKRLPGVLQLLRCSG